LLKPTLVPAVILSVVWTFNMFNIIYLVSGGQPAGANEILITKAYKIAFEEYLYAYSAAYSTVIFLILLVYGVFQTRMTRATERCTRERQLGSKADRSHVLLHVFLGPVHPGRRLPRAVGDQRRLLGHQNLAFADVPPTRLHGPVAGDRAVARDGVIAELRGRADRAAVPHVADEQRHRGRRHDRGRGISCLHCSIRVLPVPLPGRRTGMMSFLVSQMFPGTLLLVPLYIIIVSWLKLGNSFIGLVLVYSVTAIPFCVWMLKGYFDTIPLEIEESAIMDGASRQTIFFRIILPLAKPAVGRDRAVLVHDRMERVHPRGDLPRGRSQVHGPVGLKFFVGGFTSQWGYFAAGSIIVSLPVVVLFLFLQKYLVSGLTPAASRDDEWRPPRGGATG